jgi:hypothetical protein
VKFFVFVDFRVVELSISNGEDVWHDEIQKSQLSGLVAGILDGRLNHYRSTSPEPDYIFVEPVA